MPAKKQPLVKSWSYSRFADYRTCPQRFKFKHIDKITEEQSPAMARGQKIHDDLEGFVLGHVKKLPKELTDTMGVPMLNELKLLKKAKAIPEQQAGFDVNWGFRKWDDWDNTWLRVMVDLSHFSIANAVARVIDYKSGKIKEAEHAEQLELYAIFGLLKFPDATEVQAQPWYVDHGKAGAPLIFRRPDLPKLKKKWENNVAPLFRDQQFKPTPGMGCKWCPYSMRKDGPCKKG